MDIDDIRPIFEHSPFENRIPLGLEDFMANLKEFEAALLQREGGPFNADLNEKINIALNTANSRGLIGSGGGVIIVEGAVINLIKERADIISAELSEIKAKKEDLLKIINDVLEKYDFFTKKFLKKPACWGGDTDPRQKIHEQQWEFKKLYFKNYFETQFKFLYEKKKLSRQFEFKATFFWLFVGALIGNLDKLISFAKDIIFYFL